MKVEGKVVVITGGANGIGRALVERFAAGGARHVAVADLDEAGAQTVAASVGGSAFRCDVSNEADIRRVVGETEANVGTVDVFCSNAGIVDPDPDIRNAGSASDETWARAWGVNVMAHVYAARAVLPSMIARGEGWLLNTVSAAGLLSQIGSAVYSTTKHAALGLAESLAITHRDHGIRVSVLCPQAVDTAMAAGGTFLGADLDGVLSPQEVAEAAVAGLEAGQFLILPHPSVRAYMAAKVENYDRWIGGMAKLRRSYVGGV